MFVIDNTHNMAAKFPEDSPLSVSTCSEDSLTCLICTEPYRDPQVLPCQHTFCSECLEKYGDALQQEGSIEPGTLPCPVCRQVAMLPEPSETQARPATPVTDLVTRSLPSKKVYCDVCKYKNQDVAAKDHCSNCGINYCRHCIYEHSKHCLFQTHSVVPVAQMDNSSLRCEFHSAEMVRYYCMSCMSPLCTVCAVTDHQSHDTMELQAALGNKRETVEDKIGIMSEKVAHMEEFLAQLEEIQSLKEASIKKTKLEIERQVTNLIGALQSRKHNLLEELDKLHTASMKQLSIEKDNASFSLANVKSLWKFAAKLTEPSQTMQLLAMHADVMAMIEATQRSPPPSLPRDCVMINMFMPRQDLNVGNFQKCELNTDILAKVPTVHDPITNGYDRPQSPMAVRPTSPLQGALQSPPMFFKDPYKDMPQVKWLPNPKLQWKIDKIGPKTGEICESYDVTMLPDGCTVVAEWMNQRLQVLDEVGHSQEVISVGQIQPWGITVNREGNLAVTDDKDRTVKIISPTGQILVSWKKQMFGWPRGIVENTLGQYIVSDTEHGKHTVSIHLPDGRCVRKFGSQGTGNAQFHWPRYVTVDWEDRIIVSDGSNHCIKVFDPSGGFLFKFGNIGTTDGQMKHPRGVCVDLQNNIIVADQDNNRISLFSPDGKFVRHLLSISKPWGVAVNREGLLAVTQKPSVSIYKIYDLIKKGQKR